VLRNNKQRYETTNSVTKQHRGDYTNILIIQILNNMKMGSIQCPIVIDDEAVVGSIQCPIVVEPVVGRKRTTKKGAKKKQVVIVKKIVKFRCTQCKDKREFRGEFCDECVCGGCGSHKPVGQICC